MVGEGDKDIRGLGKYREKGEEDGRSQRIEDGVGGGVPCVPRKGTSVHRLTGSDPWR